MLSSVGPPASRPGEDRLVSPYGALGRLERRRRKRRQGRVGHRERAREVRIELVAPVLLDQSLARDVLRSGALERTTPAMPAAAPLRECPQQLAPIESLRASPPPAGHCDPGSGN